ncbi:uncharacterized protein [Nicotiana tomentosiformis]|uniref:uncharacterized protein n=1 Tax=Nicotiana tomentosiformis TaxID=4098 RepID=UPI00388C4475
MENRSRTVQKGKEVASEAHIKLENELKSVKSSLCAELERNRQLQEDLGRVKNDLEKSLKWTWSSDTIAAMYIINGGNRQGVGFQKEKTPYNPHSKYVTTLITGFALTVATLITLKKTVRLELSPNRKTRFLLKRSSEKKQPKMGYILEVGRTGKSHTHSIENVYYVNDLKYILLSVFQICNKGNKVEFVSKVCIVTNLVTGEVVLMAKIYKNIYVADFKSLQNGDLACLSEVDDDVELWHRRLGHASFTLLNKLDKKDLVRGLSKSSFKNHKVCDACVKGKQVRSSFKPKKEVSTSRPLDLLHMDLCGPMRVPSRGEKKYIFVIVDDYSRFIWTLFLRTKDETFLVFAAFVKKIQVKMSRNIVCIRSDHGTRWVFRNKLDKFGNTTRNKARLVVQGYNQEEGIDYDETFAPVARMEAIRIPIAFASHMEFKLFQMDVKSAFLNGFLKEEVFIKQPSRFECHEYPEHVFKLDKSLYGLKQAPREWYERLSKFLLENGFTREKIDNTLFLKKRGKNLLIVQVYVDDIIFGATNDSLCEEFAKLMGSEFERSMMGELNFFLGLQVKQTPKVIMISQ